MPFRWQDLAEAVPERGAQIARLAGFLGDDQGRHGQLVQWLAAETKPAIAAIHDSDFIWPARLGSVDKLSCDMSRPNSMGTWGSSDIVSPRQLSSDRMRLRDIAQSSVLRRGIAFGWKSDMRLRYFAA
jgi:hypothetical protein